MYFSLKICQPFRNLRFGMFQMIDYFSSRLQSMNSYSRDGIRCSLSRKNLSILITIGVTLIGLLERSMAVRFFKDSSEGIVVILLPWKEISAKALNFTNTPSRGVKSLMLLQQLQGYLNYMLIFLVMGWASSNSISSYISQDYNSKQQHPQPYLQKMPKTYKQSQTKRYIYFVLTSLQFLTTPIFKQILIQQIKQMYQKPKETTYKTDEYKRLDHSKQTMVQKIETVFVYYCGKGSKYNYQELQQKYFMEMATELFILAGKEEQFNRKNKKWVAIATLYYTKGRKKPLFHNEFLELLPGLAKEIFLDDSSPRKSLEYELEEERATKNLLLLFQKLYLHIIDEELYRRGIKSQEIEEETKEFLLKLRDSLTRLYKVYFEYEVNLSIKEKDYQNKSFDCLLEIMKDFDVYPKLISASQLYFIYLQVNNQREHHHLTLLSPSLYTRTSFAKIGEYFTLTRFVEAIILASHICVGKLKRVQGQEIFYSNMSMSQKQQVKLLLQYMQTMRSIKQKYCKFTKQRFSLIVYEEYSDYISRVRKEESLRLSPQKGTNPLSESKRSFYDILDKIGI